MISIKQAFALRNELYRAIRTFFEQRSYLEVQTPIAVPCPGTEVHLEYFATHWQDYKNTKFPLWLRSSPELHMKQILSMGLERIFQLAKCFRNGGELSRWHHPEFTMLEWYEVGKSFDDFIDDTISLLQASRCALQKSFPEFVGEDFAHNFHKITVKQAFLEWAGIELIDNDIALASQAKAKGIISVNKDDDFETAFFKILLEKIEPEIKRLGRVVFYDYPPSQAALSKIENDVAKRFEIYWDGIELCNGFFELTECDANKERIRQANIRRRELGKSITLEDENFYHALAKGIKPCCGNALGVDRLLALFCGLDGIDLVLGLDRQAPFYCPSF